MANLGSGGRSFDVNADLHVHIDLVRRRLLHKSAVVANIEQIPLRNSSVDLALCVGSVINHGNALAMIREIARVVKQGGYAVVEFDCADGLHQRADAHKNGIVSTDTFFNGHMLRLAEYSRAYVEKALESSGLTVERRHSFHIFSSLMLRLGLAPSLAAWFIYCDGLARLIRPLRYRGSNLLVLARNALAPSINGT